MQQTTLKNYFRPTFKNYKLNGHERKITAIDVDGDWVFTGSEDAKAKVWTSERRQHIQLRDSNILV
jgi:WD40 repeat protein